LSDNIIEFIIFLIICNRKCIRCLKCDKKCFKLKRKRRGVVALEEMQEYGRHGYLNEDFHLFHLRDDRGQELDFHYHDFNKIVVLIRGKVTYQIEDVVYDLRPYDVLLVSHHLIHKAQIDTSVDYERIVIYIARDFLERHSTERSDLSCLFETARSENRHLLRLSSAMRGTLVDRLDALEQAAEPEAFGADIMAQTALIRLLVQLVRMMGTEQASLRGARAVRDAMVSESLDYIQAHFCERLTVEDLANRCFVSTYHFMRSFKEHTGCTVHVFIQQKRLLYAAGLIRDGVPVVQAAAASGFQDYSTFLRAFKKMFAVTPSQFV